MSVAEPAGIDPDRVGRWLAERVEGLAAPVRFTLIAGGRSNLTYKVTDANGAAYALRRPPMGGVLETAHDMGREWRFISALADTRVPVAPPVAFCDDTSVTGAEFYVMGFVDGLVLADPGAAHELAPDARRPAGERLIDVLVALHALDPREVGLGPMVRRTGFAERQLRRWRRQAHESGGEELPLLDEVHDMLAERIPPQGNGIVHGDYRPGNIAFGPDGTVRAVFDWELATSGDPLTDLGYLVSGWQEPGDTEVVPGPTTVPGFPSREQIVDRYARLSGRDVSDVPYWAAFARWRSACINAGVRSRYLAGHMADDGYLEEARARTEQGVRLAETARDALRAMSPGGQARSRTGHPPRGRGAT
jgi:aminoglycoside phosphotransferase (APT) family kinase protein